MNSRPSFLVDKDIIGHPLRAFLISREDSAEGHTILTHTEESISEGKR